MKPRWVIAQKEFVGIFTERTILLAVIIQVFVAGFSSFLVVGLSALVDPSAFPGSAQATIALDPEATLDDRLHFHLTEANLMVWPTSDENETWSLFTGGRVQGAIFFENRTSDDQAAGPPLNMTLVLPEGNLRTTLTLVQLKEALEGYEREMRSGLQDRLTFEPVYVENSVKGGSYSFVYTLLIPLLVFLPVVLAGALCADSLTEEVQRKTLPLLLASPATPADIVGGKLLANVALAPILSIAWFFLLGLNGLAVPLIGAVAILVLSTSIAYLFGLLACLIALATRDRNKAHVLYAMGMFLLLAFSLIMPVSPVNAVALFAAGSASPAAWGVVAAFAIAASLGAIALRVALRRSAQWMAAATST